MKHTRRHLQVAVAAAAVVTAGLAGSLTSAATGAPAAPSDAQSAAQADSTIKEKGVPTFAEFEADTFRDADGQFIVNGDEALKGETELRQYYDRMVGSQEGQAGLIVNQGPGGDDLWSSSQAVNLTYCVSNAFGSSKTTVANAMAGGAALWENQSSGVDFVHVPSADASCTTSNNSVLFSIEPTNTTQYIARAFFPSSGDVERNVLVNPNALVSSGWAPSNIMGHELGHTLGFRHEHTRPEAGTCFEDNNWRPLTPYDSVSIMHYPQCNGGSSDLTFSANDASGVRSVYGG